MNTSSTGSLHRVIRIATRRARDGSGAARAVVEDDYHHFRVTVMHDGTRVTGTSAESGRKPFSLCDAAGGQLEALAGLEISKDVTSVFRYANVRLQCTHQFDIAALAIAAAARRTRMRQYHLVVPDRVDGRTIARAIRDGQEVLRWELDGTIILSPPVYAGRSTEAGFTDWVASAFEPEDAEAALVLRRAVFIATGRGMRLDESFPHAPATGRCWVQQSERHAQALRMRGSREDFSGRAELLTASDEEWLRFGE